jgi:predicted phage-related endonuclease
MTENQLALWLDARAALKERQAEIAEQLTSVEDTIRDLLGDIDTADTDRWHVTYRTVETTRIDAKKVKALLPPELRAAVQTTSTSRVLRVTERQHP